MYGFVVEGRACLCLKQKRLEVLFTMAAHTHTFDQPKAIFKTQNKT